MLEADFPMDSTSDTPVVLQNDNYLISIIVGESEVHITIHSARRTSTLKDALRSSFKLSVFE